jgi:hypothetical protein
MKPDSEAHKINNMWKSEQLPQMHKAHVQRQAFSTASFQNAALSLLNVFFKKKLNIKK